MGLLKEKIGIILIISFSVFPIILWLPFALFSSPSLILLSLGQATALVAIVLYAINIILSTRLSIFEPLFGGINKMYIVHHLAGAFAFVFMLLHPLFITLSYAFISPSVAIRFLIPSFSNFPVLLGSIGFTITIGLLVLTLYVKLEYDLWKKTHRFLGVSFMIISLHAMLASTFLSRIHLLRGFMLLLIAGALVSYFYKTVFGRIFVRKRKFVVTDAKEISKDVLEFSLTTSDSKPYKYKSGQFVFISTSVQGIPHEQHPFSIVSKNSTLPLKLCLKIVGGFTATLKLLRKDNEVLLEGPFGRFGWEYTPKPVQIWIAGGIGITPFMSMASSLPNSGYTVELYYSVKDSVEAVYLNELVQISQNNPSFKLFINASTTEGRLTADVIRLKSQIFDKATFFICGPKPLMKDLRSQLNSKGIKNTKIISEEFSLH